MRIIKPLLWTIVAANLIFYPVAVFCPPLAAYLFGMVGRMPECTFAQGADGIGKHVEENRIMDRFSRVSRVLRTESDLELWDTPRGQWWLPMHTDPGVLPDLLAQQETHFYGTGQTAVHPGDTVLDCGAHVGVFTREALKLGAVKVIAVEPVPENLESLRRNLDREIAAGRVVVCAKGVWDRVDSLTLFRPKRSSAGASFLLHSTKGEREIPRVPVTTIDLLVAELGIDRVDFIKMDIKGATERALRGARAVLQRDHPRMAVATEESGDEPARILGAVEALVPGYFRGCGTCVLQDFRVQPQVLFFGPRP